MNGSDKKQRVGSQEKRCLGMRAKAVGKMCSTNKRKDRDVFGKQRQE